MAVLGKNNLPEKPVLGKRMGNGLQIRQGSPAHDLYAACFSMPLPRDQDLTVTWPLINLPLFLPVGKPTRGAAECSKCPAAPPSPVRGARAEHRVHLETASRVLKHPGACSSLLALASPAHRLGEKSEKQRAHTR